MFGFLSSLLDGETTEENGGGVPNAASVSAQSRNEQISTELELRPSLEVPEDAPATTVLQRIILGVKASIEEKDYESAVEYIKKYQSVNLAEKTDATAPDDDVAFFDSLSGVPVELEILQHEEERLITILTEVLRSDMTGSHSGAKPLEWLFSLGSFSQPLDIVAADISSAVHVMNNCLYAKLTLSPFAAEEAALEQLLVHSRSQLPDSCLIAADAESLSASDALLSLLEYTCFRLTVVEEAKEKTEMKMEMEDKVVGLYERVDEAVQGEAKRIYDYFAEECTDSSTEVLEEMAKMSECIARYNLYVRQTAGTKFKQKTAEWVEVLRAFYISREEACMQAAISRALSLSVSDQDAKFSDVVDYVFLAVHHCVRRACLSACVKSVYTVAHHVTTTLSEAFTQSLRTQWRHAFDLSKAKGRHTEGTDDAGQPVRGGSGMFAAACEIAKSAGESVKHVTALCDAIESNTKEQAVIMDAADDRERLEVCVGELRRTEGTFKRLLRDIAGELTEECVLPDFKVDAGIYHTPTWAEHEASNVHGEFPLYDVIEYMSDHLPPLCERLGEEAGSALLIRSAAEIAARVEGAIASDIVRYNTLGALSMREGVSMLVNHAESLAATPESAADVRAAFARVSDTATVLTVGSVGEALDYHASGLLDALSVEEVSRVLRLRVDWSEAESKALGQLRVATAPPRAKKGPETARVSSAVKTRAFKSKKKPLVSPTDV